jgi:ComF family protein
MYKDALRSLILAFKNGRTELDVVLGEVADATLEGSGFADAVEMLVPVPLHWRRRLTRGYNQAQLVAGKLQRAKGKVSTDLVRVRYTKQQPVMATFAARAKNVAGAFAVRKGHAFSAKTVCLVDDIKTSGATLSECAKVLKEAGAAKVYAVVLAVAGN